MPGFLASLRAKLLLGFGFVLVLLVAISSLAYYKALGDDDASQWADHSEDVLLAAMDMRLTLSNLEADYLQFVTTGSEAALAGYLGDVERYPTAVSELSALTADKPPQIERWRALGADLDRLRQDQLDPNVELRRRALDGQASQDELNRLDQAALARGTFDKPHADMAAAIEYERQLLRERADAETAASDAVRRILTWGTLLGVLLTVGIAWLVASDIARGMERLARSAKLIAAGDLGQRVALQRTDEIGHAAAAFDQMAASLERDVAALERSEARYKELVSRADDIIYRADAQGCFTFINPIVKQILDYQPEELVGRHYLEIVHPSDRTSLRRRYSMQLLRRTSNTYNEFRALRKDGSAVWIGQNVQLVHTDAGDLGFQSIARDITSRKRAELALASLQHRTETILNTTAEGIYGIDLDGICTIVNSAAGRLTGYALGELRGSKIHDLVHHTRSDGSPYPGSECKAVLVMQRGEPTEVSDEVYWRKDGTSFPVEYSVVPIREGGLVVGAVLSFRDITERRAIERMKDEFISIVSHELRTPLTSIRGSLGLLAAGLLGPISERATRMVDIAVTNTDRLVRLINDILDIERIESGRVVMDKQWTDARDLVLRSIEAVHATVEMAHISVVPDVEPILLRADPDRVQQTLTNLIGNAVKFSPSESIIDVRARRTAQDVLFSVQDRGRGIPTDKLETIFRRFEQVDASDAREKGGSGLGLAIARSIVEQHGGRIWAESTPGHGSTFFFTLPLPGPLSALEPPADGSAPMILVCDDDPDVVEVVGEMLARHGYRAMGARSGEEALERAARDRPSAILLDLAMPGMSGWETLLLLKDQVATRDIPVLILSGLERMGNEPASGHEGWIAKPVSADALRGMLEQVLTRRTLPARILVVEDDPGVAEVLAETFRQYGIETHLADTAQNAIQISEDVDPDLLLLDLALPSGSGFDVVDWFRQHDRLRRVAVVVYTARDLNPDERRSLQLGPTEFLSKARMTPDEVRRRVLTLLERIVPAA